MNKFFSSKYPIMCAIMNEVSDLNLALAVRDAGAFPSLHIDNPFYKDTDSVIKPETLRSSLDHFQNQDGVTNIVLGISPYDLLNINFVKIIKNYRVSHLELVRGEVDVPVFESQIWKDPMVQLIVRGIKSTTKIILRINTPNANILSDGLALKGSDSAGFSGKISVIDLFNQQRAITLTSNLIPYGGIGTPDQVTYYIESGAAAVAVGTLLAASKESCLSEKTKLAMCKASSHQITNFTNTNQNALILGNHTATINDTSDWNRRDSYHLGLQKGDQGHVYAGKGIDYIKDILSVKEIIQYLASQLK